ncbi:peroxiredoxin [Psychrobium sp. 1_MG-2023]|uniref:peroxiredoxin family protein n=1 Tax=Psychrobium sp. 1_MG-2023 TaxID=3062624 RepID=UPI000C324BCB|nr:redoxin domain-containing protein [Psychrobium sp. 1_MG-2023]MDP2562661.1 redoxin domain-containing protein [Psychrobium sp. 1_MG-2023]PKF53810.1 hypothetical protein CW748_17565 [Alteromonadales bacterium alter-6D02]
MKIATWLTQLLMLAVVSASVFSANAQRTELKLLAELETVTGQTIARDKSKMTHLVFIDIWRSYGGQGDEEVVNSLPKAFLQQSQQIWLQPEINVTQAQLIEFQQHFQQVSPLVFDRQFKLMRAFGVWQSPFHVLIQGNQQIFSGDAKALRQFIDNKYGEQSRLSIASKNDKKREPQHAEEKLPVEEGYSAVVKSIKPHKPRVGDTAPTFSTHSLQGNPLTLDSMLAKLPKGDSLNLVFIDALCPMPQFPNCESKLKKLKKLVADNPQRKWLGVVNSYYVDEAYVKQFSNKFELKIPLAFDAENAIYKAYDVYASPYQIKVNHLGRIELRSDVMQ